MSINGIAAGMRTSGLIQGIDGIEPTMNSESFRVPTDDTIEKIVSRLAVVLQLQSQLRPMVAIDQDNLETDRRGD